MRIKALILLVLMLKAGVTTGLCSMPCGASAETHTIQEGSCDEIGKTHSCCDSNSSDDTDNSDKNCNCSCCHIGFFHYQVLSSQLTVSETVSQLMPIPKYHWETLPTYVFKPPSIQK